MAASADDSKSNKIVFLYNKEKDQQKYDEFKLVLDEPAKKKGFEICSYDDIQLGNYKTLAINALIKNGCIIVMIVTRNFIEDKMNEYQSQLALLHQIKDSQRLLIPIKYDDCTDIYPETLEVFSETDGSNDVNHIAARILQTVDYQIEKNTSSSMLDDPQHVPIDQYKAKKVALIDKAASALIIHYDLDRKMKKLHKKMEDKINEEEGIGLVSESKDDECPCRRGELWKNEISKEEYWAILPIGENGLQKPEPFRNIDKCRGEKHRSRHTQDIHKLYNTPIGYLKLASVFLTKRPTDKSESNNSLSECMDSEGILHLLMRCKPMIGNGPSDCDIIRKFKDLKKLRDNAAHSKIKSTEDAKEMIHNLGEKIKDSMYRILERKTYELFSKEIDKMVDAEVTMTIRPEGEASVTTQPAQSTSTDVTPDIQNLQLTE